MPVVRPPARRPRSLPLLAGLAAVLAATLSAPPTVVADDLGETWVPVPFRVRNLTFPTVLVMGFKPAPVVSLPAGTWAAEVDFAASNNYQLSPDVEAILGRPGRPQRPVDQTDLDLILAAKDDQFFIDGEFQLVDLGLHYGLTDDLDVSLQVSWLAYGGGILDAVIRNFHDTFGLGSAGRDLVPDGDFQLVLTGADGELVLLERPTAGGLTDPVFSLRWAGPRHHNRWRYGLEAGVKLPVADSDRLLSTGGTDFGVQLTAERCWQRNALLLNLAVVAPGTFERGHGLDPAALPALDVAWVHRLGRSTSAIVQLLFSENILRDVTDSKLADAEFQLTTGITWPFVGGRLGVAATENLFNYDNTPDFALHLSYARLFGGE